MKRERGAEGSGSRRHDGSPEPLECAECGAFSDEQASGWRAYRMSDLDQRRAATVAFYCPSCAEREFGRS
jgi:hypothetical protein